MRQTLREVVEALAWLCFSCFIRKNRWKRLSAVVAGTRIAQAGMAARIEFVFVNEGFVRCVSAECFVLILLSLKKTKKQPKCSSFYARAVDSSKFQKRQCGR